MGLAAGSVLHPAAAQTKSGFQPTVGQAGKDVVWVPTPQELVETMLDMARAGPGDYVIDLGSGDGRTVITAAKRGIRARGIEYNPDMVTLSRANAEKEGVSDLATFVQGDIFQTDFTDASVITLFLLSGLNQKLRPIILDMKPGTRVVSNTFDMGDWNADESATATGSCSSYCRAYFWIVPAKVQGSWQMAGGEFSLEQKYQMINGTLHLGNVNAPVNGKLMGDRISINAGRTLYTGTVNGDTIEGLALTGDTLSAWRATRAKK
jgi:SAM-dependent methyltransferase